MMGVPYTLLFLFVFICFGNAAERLVPNSVPRGWTHSDFHKRAALADQEVKVTVALSQRNLEYLESVFWKVSDPKNLDYGRYKSFQQVVDLVAPFQSSIDLVTGYFQEKGVSHSHMSLNPSKDFLTLSLSVALAEEVFQTTYQPFVHSTTGNVGVAMTQSYTLDDSISPHIDFVSHFGKISGKTVGYESPVPGTHEKGGFPFEATSVQPRSINANNAPFIENPWADNTGVYLRILFFCPDGSGPAISGNAASNSTTLACGSVNITSLNIQVESQITNNTLFTGSYNISQRSVKKCSDLTDSCLVVANYHQVSQNAAYVTIYVNASLPLYVPYVASAYATYSDNTNSSTGVSNEVEGSDLMYPSVLHSFYSVPKGTVVRSANNAQAVVSYLGESYNTQDLKQWFSETGLPDYTNLVQVVHPENNNASYPTGEATLDIQSIMGVAQNCSTFFWANTPLESDLDWITDVLNRPSAPYVFSISYLDSEKDGYTQEYFDRINVEYQKAGVRGISILYAAGDDGPFVYGGASGSVLDPAFPASSPYVTAVGGTQFYSVSNTSCFEGDSYAHCSPDEIVCSVGTGAGITAGGGFSNVFTRPSYQDGAVNAYLPGIKSMQGVNFTNRAYPDISFIGHNAPVILSGEPEVFDGTSASTPYFAGIVTLLNDIRLSSGNAPLGFLNPFIYSLDQSAFKDIVRGSNNCTRLTCYPIGYSAVTGWDAASGRGSPIFSKWAAAVANLPPTPSSTSTSSTSSTSSNSTTTHHTSGAVSIFGISSFSVAFVIATIVAFVSRQFSHQ